MQSNEIYKKLLNLIDDELNKTIWLPSDLFSNIRKLSIDQRGRVGEYFFKFIFNKLCILNKYIDNSHGDWDIEADGLKIEIKTATLDVNKKFQHEGIKENKKWDVIAFLDIAPNNLYVTFIHKNDFEFGIESIKNNGIIKNGVVNLYGKKQNIHFRGKENTNKRATGAGYKVDFRECDLIEVKTIDDIKNNFIEMKVKNNL